MLLKILFYFGICAKSINSQFEPQSNIDRIAQRPVLPQCPREWEWSCRNGECIAHYDVCDGIVQCTDGSDEWNCDSQRNINGLPHEGNDPPVKGNPTTLSPVTTTIKSNNLISQSVTIQYKHLLIAFAAFAIISFVLVNIIRRRARKKSSGFRNRRPGHNILQQDSDEDDILISSMYS